VENKNKKTNEELEAKRDLEFAEVEEEPIVVHKASKFGRSKKTKKKPVKLKKKIIMSVIILLISGLLLGSIISSYSSDMKLSNSAIPESLIPVGEYNNYIKGKVRGITDKERLDAIDIADLASEIVVPRIDPILIDLQTGVASDEAFDFKYMNANNSSAVLPNGDKVPGYYTSNDGTVTWNVNVPETGFYNIHMTYYPEKTRNEDLVVLEKSGGANIEKTLYINGELPFGKASNLKFTRVWTNASPIIEDLNGNDMKPAQKEIFDLTSVYFRDQKGYVTEPYMFYFTEGNNTISLESVRENMTITELAIMQVDSKVNYSEYLDLYSDEQITSGHLIEVEGQDASKRSSPTLYAIADRTSPKNNPTDPVRTKLNAIGGTKWTTPGDWITWEIDAPEAGFYEIAFKAKQNSSRGLFSTRRVYVNGVVPFLEANQARFNYSTDWKLVSIGDSESPFLFYLDAGVNEVTLESTLGSYGEPVETVRQVTNELNAMYLKIIAITTVNPDPYQQYHLYGDKARIDGLLESFEKNAKKLREVSSKITEVSGEKSDLIALLDKMAIQLEDFLKKPRTIQERLNTFSQNISSLGTWITDIQEQSLVVEAVFVSSPDVELPSPNANWFANTWFSISSFVQSFFFDYQSVGVTTEGTGENTIDVWFLTSVTSGREQANAFKSLADSTFTNVSGIDINLKVVAPGVLLPNTLSGTGPDVAINVDGGLPVNYALRNAIYDISQFDDFIYEKTENGYKVLMDGEENSRFADSAFVPFELNGGFYAMPNTQSFLVMFYRTDIFEDNGWVVPETWDEVTSLVTELQISNLQFFLPLNVSGATSVVNPVFASMLFQNGGAFYTDNNIKSALDSEEAMISFEEWAKYYTDYSFPLSASFINRFRSGETPIGIAYYETFNTLAVFAPEITGKWAFAPLPGFYDEETGEYNNKGAAGGSAAVIMKQTKKPDESWEFLKWWTSAETQASYGTELESILGAAARHNTANIEAFSNMAWTKEEKSILLSQWRNTVGIPQVAGGYYTGRNIENAFRKTVNEDLNPREVLLEYVEQINNEIIKKREEFGLPIA